MRKRIPRLKRNKRPRFWKAQDTKKQAQQGASETSEQADAPSPEQQTTTATKQAQPASADQKRQDKQPFPVEPVKQITPTLRDNKAYLQELFRDSSDIVIREFCLANGLQALVIFVDGLVNSMHVDEILLKPLMYGNGRYLLQEQPPQSVADLMQQFLAVGQAQPLDTLTNAIDAFLTGDTVFFVDHFDTAIKLSIKQWEHRSPSEPDTEAVVRGPREGFTENIRTNTALLRRRIRSPHFQLEGMKIGRVSKTDVVVGFIKGICSESLVNEVRERLQRIDIDGVVDSGYIEEFLEDQPFSPFPTIQPTERPDTVAAGLLEGRVIILVDGSPFALIAPITLWGSLQSNEDYYERYMFSTMIRWLRYIFVVIALTLPSLYIAITTFHQEMLPTNLLLSIAAARESSPFPALVEALAMEITFEALREAGVRLPKTVGQAVSIVGALVIGQAAVQAGIVSAPMVIVVSLTGIANFTIPRYSFALSIRMLRFPLMILAGTFGLYGIVIGLIGIVIHVCSIRSIGIPYTTPVAPLSLPNLKDIFLRAPWWALNRRPHLFGYQNPMRIPYGQKPHPPQPEADDARGESG